MKIEASNEHKRFKYILLLASKMARATSAIAFCATSNVGSTMMVGILNFTSTSNLYKQRKKIVKLETVHDTCLSRRVVFFLKQGP